MNRHARNVISEFISRPNTRYLFTTVSQRFANPAVDQYIHSNFMTTIDNFVKKMEREMSTTDAVAGVTVIDTVRAYNREFLVETCSFITDHVITEHQPEVYRVDDGIATSRYGAAHHMQSATDILKSWDMNSSRGIQAREDPQGGYSGNNTITYSNTANRGDGLNCDQPVHTGVVFCDQSAEGTSNHVTQFYTPMMQAMNRVAPEDMYQTGAFGEATAESDARLLSRRTFRSESGVENGVPMRQARLHRRSLDTNINEGLRQTEHGTIVYAHDMSSLYRRVDEKRAMAAAHTPPRTEFRPQYNQQNENMRRNEQMRHC